MKNLSTKSQRCMPYGACHAGALEKLSDPDLFSCFFHRAVVENFYRIRTLCLFLPELRAGMNTEKDRRTDGRTK